MAKLGSYGYPKIKLSRAVEIVRRIAEDFKGQVSVTGLATGLDMAERGGGFANLVASLRDYGLVDGRRDIRITPAAESIIYEGDQSSYAQAFYNVELFRRMAEKLAGDVPADARLRAILQEVTGESLTKINSRLGTLRSVWADGLQLCGPTLPDALTDAPQVPADAPGAESRERHPVDELDTEFAELRIGESYVRVRRDVKAIDVVVKLLNVLREELNSEHGAVRMALPPPSTS